MDGGCGETSTLELFLSHRQASRLLRKVLQLGFVCFSYHTTVMFLFHLIEIVYTLFFLLFDIYETILRFRQFI